MFRENEIKGLPGGIFLLLLLAVIVLATTMFVSSIKEDSGTVIILGWLALAIAAFVCLFGLTVVNPNEAKVVQLFGRYKGTLKQQGLQWVNPFTTRRRVS